MTTYTAHGITATNVEEINVPRLFSSETEHGWAMTLICDDITYGVSTLDNDGWDGAWVIDSMIGANGMPIVVHGKGARDCSKRPITDEAQEVANEALRRHREG